MVLKLYNTLKHDIEIFKPIDNNLIKIYSCGPTVYNYAHIGNLRAFIFSDLLKRYLKFKGYKVKHVMNITDIDDKTIRDSQREGKSLREFTEFYTKEFFKDLETLNIEKADIFPKATEHIKQMIDLIEKLEKNNHTYTVDGSVYYKISTFPNYGKLVNLNLDNLKINAQGRLSEDEYKKEDARDFALWKSYSKDDGDVFFNTKYGKGRPGWHIECSTMSMHYLGETFDIHTGGIDLCFPHHSNEIAQSEGATGKPFVNYWLHNEHLIVEGQKMSKSLGNFYTLRDLLAKGYDPKVIRYLLLTTQYRQKLNFTFAGLDAAKSSINRIQELVDKLIEEKYGMGVSLNVNKYLKKFEDAMDNDLNIGDALISVFDFVRDVNKIVYELSEEENKRALNFLKKINSILGVLSFEKVEVPQEIILLAEKRKEARMNKNWDESDKLRDLIKEKGYMIGDNKDGSYILKPI